MLLIFKAHLEHMDEHIWITKLLTLPVYSETFLYFLLRCFYVLFSC